MTRASRVTLPAAVACLLPGALLAQNTAPDPNDAPVAELKRLETLECRYLLTHPGAVALPPKAGQLRFRNSNSSHTSILGSVTHRDPRTGAWIANAPVLSGTKNGWRIDGTLNNVIIKKQGNFAHMIVQTFTNFENKHDSVRTFTVPALAGVYCGL